jgi:putative restriction endonuclease
MSSARTAGRWTRTESILALNLYLTTPFGRLHARNPEVIELANVIRRTPGAVALKLVNFARLDPDLQARGVRGMSHGSARDVDVWNEFVANREALVFESERLRAEYVLGVMLEQTVDLGDVPTDLRGTEREAFVRVRVNQQVFRRMILARFEGRCCVTGLSVQQLLVASHIVPWSESTELRLNPRNGLCLNSLHDRAFEHGLMTVSDDLRVRISGELVNADEAAVALLAPFNGRPLTLPDGWEPDRDLLRRHRDRFISGA